MRRSFEYLRIGGCLWFFLQARSLISRKQKCVLDGEWNDAAALAKKTGGKVVPVYFEGRNSLPLSWISAS